MADLRKRYMAGFYRTDSMEGKKLVSLRQKETTKESQQTSKQVMKKQKQKKQKQKHKKGVKMKRQMPKSSESYIPPPSWSLYSGGMAAGRGRGEALQWILDEAGYRSCSSSMAAGEARHRRRWRSSGRLSGWSMRRL